jgi:hypothetical protein
MNTHAGRVLRVVTITGLMLTSSAAAAIAQPAPFRDSAQGLWGYAERDGRIVIPARFLGAGAFRDGRAPVEDAEGFAIINGTGIVIERISVRAVSPTADAVPPPGGSCGWSPVTPFPSRTLDCYVGQLRGSGLVVGGELTRRPGGRESASSAIVLKLPNGVIVHEEIGYEGSRHRVLLPGVSADQALEWRRFLHPDVPPRQGCDEFWTSGAITGGAFIEQHAGC